MNWENTRLPEGPHRLPREGASAAARHSTAIRARRRTGRPVLRDNGGFTFTALYPLSEA